MNDKQAYCKANSCDGTLGWLLGQGGAKLHFLPVVISFAATNTTSRGTAFNKNSAQHFGQVTL
ncbi:hypothetical protein QG37_05260 [Candidozyma auris]|nr:hypothetical protein QG37_05260 [[Candida] auris]